MASSPACFPHHVPLSTHLHPLTQLKIDLKNQAMAALPEDQLAYAKEMPTAQELFDFPLDFRYPTYTPPIQGYRADDWTGDGEDNLVIPPRG